MKKTLHILPLAALSAAFTLLDQADFANVAIESNHRQAAIAVEWDAAKHDISAGLDSAVQKSKQTYSELIQSAKTSAEHVSADAKDVWTTAVDSTDSFGDSIMETAFNPKQWSESRAQDAFSVVDGLREHHGPPHHGPPHHDGPHHGPPHHDDPHHGPPHHGPPHHGPHHEPNETVYQLIASSKYTTKLAKLINEYPDLVETLNGTKANYTVFAPIDSAFDKIPEDAPKPTEEELKMILQYHISPEFYPAGRVLVTHTIPTLLQGERMPIDPRPQRLSVNIGLRGLTLNFYDRVVAVNIFGTNGVIHGVSSVLVPPPNALKIIDMLPSRFSTLELGLTKTGILEEFNNTHHPGGTLYAPDNFAFAKLGTAVNAYLFSEEGLKCLRGLLLYHFTPKNILYSDAAYLDDQDDHGSAVTDSKYSFLNRKPCHKQRKAFSPASLLHKRASEANIGDEHHAHKLSKGYFHYDFPTFLKGQKLNIDVVKYGPYIGIKANGYASVVVQDGVARDGVIQTVSSVLLPPKNKFHHGASGWFEKVKSMFGDAEMIVEEFKARFEGLV